MSAQVGPTRAVIGLGANLRQRATLPAALARLADALDGLRWSATWRSPCQAGGQRPYWNLVATGMTRVDRASLERQLGAIEKALGRRRGADAEGEVALDLDLLLLDAGPGSAPYYVRSAADLLEAAHVRVPLAELLPDWRHPDSATTLGQLVRQLPAGGLSLVAPRDFPWLDAAAVASAP